MTALKASAIIWTSSSALWGLYLPDSEAVSLASSNEIRCISSSRSKIEAIWNSFLNPVAKK